MVTLITGTLFLAGCGKAQIGYIDTDKIQQDPPPQLKTIIDEGNGKITALEKEVKQKLQENPNMSAEEANKIQSDGQRQAAFYQHNYSTQLKQKTDEALDAVYKEKKLDVILQHTYQIPTAFMGAVDVTDDVIAKLQ